MLMQELHAQNKPFNNFSAGIMDQIIRGWIQTQFIKNVDIFLDCAIFVIFSGTGGL